MSLFNQINNLVGTYSRTVGGSNRAATVANNLSVFMNGQNVGVQSNNNILPQVNLSNNPQVKQNQIINQQLQESILQTQEALKEFTDIDKSSLVKGMLNMPEDLGELLKLLSNKNENLTNAEFMKLLSMLNTNSKEAAAKLSKLLVILGSNNIKGTEKLQEIYTIINAMASGSAQNASQLMKNIILLYLPWLPIGENNNFELGLQEAQSKDEENDEENSESDNVVVFIQTVNYSNVKVTLYKEIRQSVKMFVECVPSFPKDELMDMVKGDAQKLNVSAQVDFASTTPKEIVKNDEQDFNVNVSKFINPYLMLMAQAVIKAVIAIDKHTSLIEKRRASQ